MGLSNKKFHGCRLSPVDWMKVIEISEFCSTTQTAVLKHAIDLAWNEFKNEGKVLPETKYSYHKKKSKPKANKKVSMFLRRLKQKRNL